MTNHIDISKLDGSIKLSRTTMWRVKKRGWFTINYHTKDNNRYRDDSYYISNIEMVEFVVKNVSYRVQRRGLLLGIYYIDLDDIRQEIRLSLLLNASKIRAAEKPKNLAFTIGWQAAIKSLGLYGKNKPIQSQKRRQNESQSYNW